MTHRCHVLTARVLKARPRVNRRLDVPAPQLTATLAGHRCIRFVIFPLSEHASPSLDGMDVLLTWN